MNFPTLLTYFRIILIPAIMVAFYLPGSFGHLLAAIIFAIASLTDWLDGYLARNWNQTTKFGAFLDPVADKLIISIALVLIVAEMGSAYIAIPAAVIIGREIVISALREWMAEIGKKTSVAVSRVAKIKTTLQMFAVGSLLLHHPAYGVKFLILGTILLYLAAGMTLWSMYMYLKTAWPDLVKNN
ncbi:MAG: CDP-diacylglycerol-glycerol-3-phosphate 3-phosphatidyltransferase [uncultured bacterium]|nr:MAG: CDP-diacylglycerol-glycerol-3-phosphate 3-phosphatidyltransferase [uncultured bacterium]